MPCVKYIYLLLPLLVLIPMPADAWIDTLYEYEKDGLISGTELQMALDYLRGLGFNITDTVLFYSVGEMPKLEYAGVPYAALEDAITSWEDANPGLELIELDTADFVITWVLSGSGGVDADCRPGGQCDVPLGGYDCNGNFVQANIAYVQYSIMHRIGHVLALEHAFDKSSLMYGHDGKIVPDWDGYVVPEAPERLYVGQFDLTAKMSILDYELAGFAPYFDTIEDEFNAIEAKLVVFDGKIGSMESYLDRLNRLMADSTSEEYVVIRAEYDKISEELVTASAEYESTLIKHAAMVEMYDEQNNALDAVHDARQVLADKYACYPETG